MCGIAGFWGPIARRGDSLKMLRTMTSALAHRGPDGQNCWLGADVGLGHSRLAIIDIAGGTQPMWDVNETSVVVFNGEIYNYKELETELEGLGYSFKTRSDTEVIIAAVNAWGIERGLRRLRGMFAFALYNARTHCLLLARDRVGVKPLYWAQTSEGVLFASEQKALLASGLLSERVNPVAIHDYLAQGFPTTPSTCWADIQMVEPGTWIEVRHAGVRTDRYWRWRPNENRELRIEEATENLRATLLDALRCHLVSDVEVGAFLSGGLDSSLVVALLSKGLAPGIPTFNMGFADTSHDESRLAQRVATHCNTEHHQARCESGETDPDLFSRILAQFDEPFGDSSCIPVFLICREMRKRVKVVLSGDGGDEVLGGYIRYLTARRLAFLARFRPLRPVLTPISQLLERHFGPSGHRLAKAWRFAQIPRIEMLCALNTYFSETERCALYKPEFAQLALSSGATASRLAPICPADVSDPIQQLVTADMRLRLHADYLRKVDIASSAHGLEVRVPYLDSSMLDLAAELPVRLKIGADGQTKVLSRRLASQLLPPEIAGQPKRGFTIPFDTWAGNKMRGFLRDLLLDSQACITSWFERERISGVWRAFDGGGNPDGLSRYSRYQRVFLLAALELWLRRWSPTLA